MSTRSNKRSGFATIEPYEAVVLDEERAAKNLLRPWRSKNAKPGRELYYSDGEVKAMTDAERDKFDDHGMPVR